MQILTAFWNGRLSAAAAAAVAIMIYAADRRRGIRTAAHFCTNSITAMINGLLEVICIFGWKQF